MIFVLLYACGISIVLTAAWESPVVALFVVGRLLMVVANEMGNAWLDKHEDYKIED